MIDRLRDLGPTATVAALHAVRDLPLDQRLDIAETALAAHRADDVHVALALADLLTTIEPDSAARRARVERLIERLPEERWTVRAALRHRGE